MQVLGFLIPVAIFLGFMGLLAFFWAVRTGQYEDLDGSGERILFDEEQNDDQAR
ncbi:MULTISPECIES: cbb3-type cytochrome oxidase assembly protein CcoS [Devosia]|uniref:Cytochrome oxidase maturation protein cbb3-type n=1 Tax=Devosia equisanguinis TaxID=2490941 RepID=A0A3S4DMS9_9HYPH|nr:MULTISPECIES: cbb3-type cytochrome oxidase assembly protein CcoS [Devosia]ODT51022.1 MAG: cytochrome oxidase maturation protein, cbb3-type [Pelagibacterium sp. SCN 63-126]ODU84566.1 MAG: cytochrome oxidase maturation protein, cbb3-type [Pelagibacterium sp. SCN 63-17]OJX44319.1 MAG: cytochrome oxidase maturation protein, cbb3-type [Devosia sp. 63-57]VDS03035.1 Cytochrome oxidase maturation protein cbb3-type [Devosia equisanguinis]